MTNTKIQFIAHKALLVAFISVCILSTAASCSGDNIDKPNKLNGSLVTYLSSIQTSSQSKSSLLNNLNENIPKNDNNSKPESGTLDQRFDDNLKNNTDTNANKAETTIVKPIEIQTNVQPTQRITETQKPISVELQPNIEKQNTALNYISPKLAEPTKTISIPKQTSLKELISSPIQNAPVEISQTQKIISSNNNLTCKDIGHRVYRGDPEYSIQLDKDGDGIGCESFKK